MNSTNEKRGSASELNELFDCKCGYEAGKVGYTGGRNGSWVIRCTGSKCPAVAQAANREAVVYKWNDMQSAI